MNTTVLDSHQSQIKNELVQVCHHHHIVDKLLNRGRQIFLNLT